MTTAVTLDWFVQTANARDQLMSLLSPQLNWCEVKKIADMKIPRIGISEVIRRNNISPPNVIKTRGFNQSILDEWLLSHLPLIGSGTEALVFDLGTCVLKRVIADDRAWEMRLFGLARQVSGLFVDLITAPIDWSEVLMGREIDCDFFVQQKLTVVDVTVYSERIKELYPYPVVIEEYKYWEWGVDERDIPHVYDWG
jgi:hypothetical protein